MVILSTVPALLAQPKYLKNIRITLNNIIFIIRKKGKEVLEVLIINNK